MSTATVTPEIVQTFEVLCCPSVFNTTTQRTRNAPVQLNVREAMEHVGWEAPDDSTSVYLGGVFIPLKFYEHIRPRADVRLTLILRPSGPETWAAIGAFFAAVGEGVVAGLTYAASFEGVAAAIEAGGLAAGFGYGAGAIIGTVAITAGVSALTNALIKPPDQDSGSMESGRPSPSLQATGNRIRQNEPVPSVYGDIRIFPALGGFPYSVIRGSENLLRLLFLVGTGVNEISEPMIGEVPLSSFPRARMAIRSGFVFDGPLTIYTNEVQQLALNQVFDERRADEVSISPWAQYNVPGDDVEEISVDFSFPTGIFRRNEHGSLRYHSVGLQIQVRNAVGPGAWVDATTIPTFSPMPSTTPGLGGGPAIDGAPTLNIYLEQGVIKFVSVSARPFIVGFSWRVTAGSYDVQIRRFETEGPSARTGGGNETIIASTFVWTALRGLAFTNPLGPRLQTQCATVELEIPLDEQFNGFSANFSVRVKRYLSMYNPSDPFADADGWSAPVLPGRTRNPAAAARDILQGLSKKTPYLNSELEIPDFTAWYLYCEAFNQAGSGPLTFDHVFDYLGRASDQLALVMSAARAAPIIKNGKLGVLIDKDQSATAPKALITPANTNGFRYRFVYPKKIHGIKCAFIDRDEGFNPNGQIIVYADGYSSNGAGGTIVADENQMDSMRFIGTTDRRLVFVQARFLLAGRVLQRRTVEVEQDIEHLSYNIGEVVKLSHDGSLLGTRWGYVKFFNSYRFFEQFERETNPYTVAAKDLTNGTIEYGYMTPGFFTEGQGGARIRASSTALVTTGQTFAVARDWSGFVVELDARAPDSGSLSSGDGLRIAIFGPTLSDFRVWNFGTSAGLSSTAMATVALTIGTTSPSSSGGSFNAASVIRYEVRTNGVGGAAGKIWSVDNFRVHPTDTTQLGMIMLDGFADMAPGADYRIDIRKINTGGGGSVEVIPYNVIGPSDINNPLGIADALYLFLKSPVAGSPAPFTTGDLYAFGTTEAVTGRFLVKNKQPMIDLRAVVTLIDEAPERFNAVTTIDVSPPASQIQVPISQIGPSKPNINQIVADERALLLTREGSLITRIALLVQPGTQVGRTQPQFWAVRYRRIDAGATAYKAPQPYPAATNLIYISEVDEDATYEVLIRAIDGQGRPSEEVRQEVYVSGKTNRPPNVPNFRVENASIARWDTVEVPLDFAGYRITKSRVGGTYALSERVHGNSLITAPPFVLVNLPLGEYTLYIVMVDKVGNESLTPTSVNGTFGALEIQNVFDTTDYHALGFPKDPTEESEVLMDFENFDDFEIITGQLPAGFYVDVDTISNETGGTVFINGTGQILGGLKSCTIDGNGVAAPRFGLTFPTDAPLNALDRKLEFAIYINRAGTGTFTVRTTFWSDGGAASSRYDATSKNGLAELLIRADLAAAATATTGGGVDELVVERITIDVTGGGFTTTDDFILDDLVWKAGTVNTVEVEGGSGDLITTEIGSFYSNVGSSLFYDSDGGSNFYNSSFKKGRYFFSLVVGGGDLPANLRIGVDAPDSQTRLYYKDTFGVFVDFPAVLKGLTAQTYYFLLELDGGGLIGRVEGLTAVLEIEDEVEIMNNVVIASGGAGTRLTLTKTYRSIKKVDLTVEEDGNGGRYAVLVDKNPSTGPLITVYNGSNARVTGLIDARVTGVRG